MTRLMAVERCPGGSVPGGLGVEDSPIAERPHRNDQDENRRSYFNGR